VIVDATEGARDPARTMIKCLEQITKQITRSVALKCERRYSLVKLIDEISFPFPSTNCVQASHGL